VKHILEGTRVLDFSHYLAGPSCTRMLAEMGAEVVKVELAPTGDGTRQLPLIVDGRSGYYVQQNRGKKSVCLNHKDPRSIEALKELVKTCDVLVENFSVGIIAKMGLGWDAVHEINPKLVMCSISAFGQEGPLSGQPGYDYIAAAYTGITSIIGTEDGTPVLPMCAFGDVGTGVSAAGSIGYALLHAERTGKGQYLDISLIDTYYQYNDTGVEGLSISKGAFMPRASGAHHFAGGPLGFYQGQEMTILIIALPLQWPRFCEAIGMPELMTDPRFVEMVDRMEHHAALVDIITEWIHAQESDQEVIRILEEARIPVAPILNAEQAINHPHLLKRGTAQKVTDRALGEFTIPAMSYRFSKFPPLELQAPFLGEHNVEVLTELAGLSPEQVDEMTADGALVSEPIPNA
jgi:crotonobetainyl-CoA:carnitine CoA-transferase CaiB-like acyl-CoA transferase